MRDLRGSNTVAGQSGDIVVYCANPTSKRLRNKLDSPEGSKLRRDNVEIEINLITRAIDFK